MNRSFEETMKHEIFARECFLALDGLVYASKVFVENGANTKAVEHIIKAMELLVKQVSETNNKIETQTAINEMLNALRISRGKGPGASQ